MHGKVSVEERLADVEKVVGELAESLSSLRHVVSCLADEVANQHDDRPTLPLNADEWESRITWEQGASVTQPTPELGWFLVCSIGLDPDGSIVTLLWARKRTESEVA